MLFEQPQAVCGPSPVVTECRTGLSRRPGGAGIQRLNRAAGLSRFSGPPRPGAGQVAGGVKDSDNVDGLIGLLNFIDQPIRFLEDFTIVWPQFR